MWKVKDRNGIDLNIGDLVNIFYTSYDGEWRLNGRRIHDQVMQCMDRDIGKLNRVKI
jgi:hypothetical protein